MLNYKIIIPVTAQVELLDNCLTGIKDKGKLCVLNNFDNQIVEQRCFELEKEGAEIHHFPWNLGAGPSFNFAMKMTDRYGRGLDYVIILSPACVFDSDVTEFAEAIEKNEENNPQLYYNSPANLLTDMHAIAFTRKLYNEIGLFDENLWPYGYDDMDMQYRLSLRGYNTFFIRDLKRHSQKLGQGAGSDPRLFRHHQENVEHQADYYRRKWGGEHQHEVFKTPFNNPYLSIKDWTLELDKLTLLK